MCVQDVATTIKTTRLYIYIYMYNIIVVLEHFCLKFNKELFKSTTHGHSLLKTPQLIFIISER